MTNKKFTGDKISLESFIGHTVYICDYLKNKSKKENGNDFYTFQILMPALVDGKKKRMAYQSWNSSASIRCFFERVENGDIKLPVKTKVLSKKRNSLYFEGYDNYGEIAGEELADKFGDLVDFDDSEYGNLVIEVNK